MSKSVLILGPSGAGKSSSIRTLNPESTFLVNALAKDLPWKGSAKQYTYFDKDKNPKGNMIKTANTHAILTWLDHINQKMTYIKDVVIDDNTFLTSLELLRRAKEQSWDKFTDIAQNFIALADKTKGLRDDLVVYIMHHVQSEGDGILEEKKVRAMSYGKLIDEKMGTLEAQFSVVLMASKEKTDNGIEYVFLTRDANSTTKTPMDMFEEDKIPNDLSLVRKAIDEYYN